MNFKWSLSCFSFTMGDSCLLVNKHSDTLESNSRKCCAVMKKIPHHARHPFSLHLSLLTNSEHIKPLKKNIRLRSRWEVLCLVIIFNFQSWQANIGIIKNNQPKKKKTPNLTHHHHHQKPRKNKQTKNRKQIKKPPVVRILYVQCSGEINKRMFCLFQIACSWD